MCALPCPFYLMELFSDFNVTCTLHLHPHLHLHLHLHLLALSMLPVPSSELPCLTSTRVPASGSVCDGSCQPPSARLDTIRKLAVWVLFIGYLWVCEITTISRPVHLVCIPYDTDVWSANETIQVIWSSGYTCLHFSLCRTWSLARALPEVRMHHLEDPSEV